MASSGDEFGTHDRIGTQGRSPAAVTSVDSVCRLVGQVGF